MPPTALAPSTAKPVIIVMKPTATTTTIKRLCLRFRCHSLWSRKRRHMGGRNSRRFVRPKLRRQCQRQTRWLPALSTETWVVGKYGSALVARDLRRQSVYPRLYAILGRTAHRLTALFC
jgi:hypothetical protein